MLDAPTAELAVRVSERLGDRWPGSRLASLTRLAGGRSGITYLATVYTDSLGAASAPEHVVVKTIPPGMTAIRNRDIMRQGRLVSALYNAGLPVPEVVAQEAGDPPAMPPFLVLGFVEGDSYDPTSWSSFDPAGRHPVDRAAVDVEARAGAAMETLARLQRFSLGDLGDPGERGNSLADEVARWQAALATTVHGADRAVGECAAALLATVPVEGRRVLVHGDFRLGNLLCVGTEVRSVIDWEIWSVGDSRLDLGWFVARFDPSCPAVPPGPPLPAPGLLLDAYERSGGYGHDRFAWFCALAAFKQAAASALIDKRSAPKRSGRAGRTAALITWAIQQLEER